MDDADKELINKNFVVADTNMCKSFNLKNECENCKKERGIQCQNKAKRNFNKKFDCSEGSQIRDFIYIDDIITSIIKALKTKKTNGQIFNIGSGKKVSIKFIINFTKNFYKKGIPIYGKIRLRKDESKAIYPNIDKSYYFFNLKPKKSLRINLLKTLKFYKKKYKCIN